MRNLFLGALFAVLLIAVSAVATVGTIQAQGVQTDGAQQQCVEPDGEKRTFYPGDTGYDDCVAAREAMEESKPEATATPAPAATTMSECKPRTYTRMRTVEDKIDGKVVGTYQFPESITLTECPTAQAGTAEVRYTIWARKAE